MELNKKQRLQAYRVLLGEALAKERKAHNLSQQDIADKTGISRVSVSYYENGIRSINMDDLVFMCSECNLNIERIFIETQHASEQDVQEAYAKYFDTISKVK